MRLPRDKHAIYDLWCLSPSVLRGVGSYLTSRCRTSRQRSAMSWNDLASSLRVCVICSDTGGRSTVTWLSWAGDSTEKEGREQRQSFHEVPRDTSEMMLFCHSSCCFTNLASAGVGSSRHPRQDRMFLFLIKTRSPMTVLNSQNDKSRISELEVTLVDIWPSHVASACVTHMSSSGCSPTTHACGRKHRTF